MFSLQEDISEELDSCGCSVVSGSKFSLTGQYDAFTRMVRSWETMSKDKYYGNEGKATRYRRYSDFIYSPKTGKLLPTEHRPYFQSETMNHYVGGLERHFEDIDEDLMTNPLIESLVQLDFEIYKGLLPEELWDQDWQCQIHQIRIEVEPGQEVEITPEGIHSDGYPFSAVHFGGKENISGANSRVYTQQKQQITETRFEEFLDTLYFKDRDLMHYVTPAKTADNSAKGYRQIIAISFSIPGTEYDTVR
ncbi:MAG: 2OG-Fe dioxygenase family protein [Pseudomonadota bacterium]